MQVMTVRSSQTDTMNDTTRICMFSKPSEHPMHYRALTKSSLSGVIQGTFSNAIG